LALRIHGVRAEPRDVLRAGEELRRDRATRSRASVAIAVVGIINIVSAAMPPLRERLSLVLHLVPLAVPQIASALLGLSGLALLALAWGVRKGQRQAWTVSVVILIGSAVLHLVKGVELTESLLPLLILGYLISGRHAFQTSVDLPSRRFAALWLICGTLTATVLATTGLEIFYLLDTPRTPLSIGRAYLAVTERMVGDSGDRVAESDERVLESEPVVAWRRDRHRDVVSRVSLGRGSAARSDRLCRTTDTRSRTDARRRHARLLRTSP